jgi:hypothetical protein
LGGGIKGLLNADGSVLVVIKRYEHKARKYAELFNTMFGKAVEVRTVAGFHELFPTQYFSGTPIPMELVVQ